jgi:hypothetical protein
MLDDATRTRTHTHNTTFRLIECLCLFVELFPTSMYQTDIRQRYPDCPIDIYVFTDGQDTDSPGQFHGPQGATHLLNQMQQMVPAIDVKFNIVGSFLCLCIRSIGVCIFVCSSTIRHLAWMGI